MLLVCLLASVARIPKIKVVMQPFYGHMVSQTIATIRAATKASQQGRSAEVKARN
jgi:hypothetical protein